VGTNPLNPKSSDPHLVAGRTNSCGPSRCFGHPIFVFTACLASLGVLGWIDYLTGYELGFFVFYSAPVGLAAWQLGRWPAIAVSLAASLTWWLADSRSGVRYSSSFYLYWNNAIHFVSFVVNAVAIARIKKELDHRRQLAAELEAARAALRAVGRQPGMCPTCGSPIEPSSQST
jgi:hypothetical protein